MCGIAGIAFQHPKTFDPKLLTSFSKSLNHRGPDDFGYLVASKNQRYLGKDPHVYPSAEYQLAFVHRRLSILDLSKLGWQPMSTEDGRYHMVFNGEIYNYLELRDELKARGISFKSNSDSEVLLKGFAYWGKDILPKLTGMFAFVIWDTTEKTLFLARDPFGIKPLFYVYKDGCFAFSSESSLLYKLPIIKKSADAEQLYQYIRYGYSDHNQASLIQGVFHLKSAHHMTLSLTSFSQPELVRYWDIDRSQTFDGSFEEATQKVKSFFLKNIELHMRSDVEVGFALSGGVDSTAIVMGARHLCPNARLHAFSYIPDDPKISEERWIQQVVKEGQITLHKTTINPNRFMQDLDALIRIQGEPFGSTSIYAQNLVFEKAKEIGVKVMLDGQGADELLAGYNYYKSARFASLIRQGRWISALRFLRASSTYQSGHHFMYLLKMAGEFLLPQELQKVARWVAGEGYFPAWVDAKWFHKRAIRGRSHYYSKSKNVLRESLYKTVAETTLPRLLRYEDRNSMAHSIESRVPFLTADFATFLFTLPEHYLINERGTTKHVFKEAMRGIVPDSILDRRDKIGFNTPEHAMLLQTKRWVENQVLYPDALRAIPFLDQEAVQKSWAKACKGKYDQRLWRVINIARWSNMSHVHYK